MRFDVLLFELRLFKSRSQARQAIEDGEALLNHERAKPSRVAHAGDLVTLFAAGRTRTLEVLALPHATLSKAGARELVREVAEG